jgi:hypothetical protein
MSDQADEFLLSFPLYFWMADQDHGYSVRSRLPDGTIQQILPFFTDTDLANRYAIAAKIHPLRLGKHDTPDEFLNFLAAQAKAVVTFDPPDPAPGRTLNTMPAPEMAVLMRSGKWS